jgi:hypothetical protein
MPRKPKQTALASINPSEVMLLPPPAFDGSLDSLAKLIKGDLESLPDARRRIVELLRGEEDMEKFVKAHDKLARDPRKPAKDSLDIACEKSGVNRSVAFGAIARVLHRYNFDVTQIAISACVAAGADQVTRAMVTNATMPLGHADRALFMDVAGARKKAGGVTVNVPINNQVSATAGAQATVEQGREMPPFEDGVRSMAAALRKIPTGGA